MVRLYGWPARRGATMAADLTASVVPVARTSRTKAARLTVAVPGWSPAGRPDGD
jgi:hypothetical protein